MISAPGSDERQKVVDYLTAQLIGPLDGAEEILHEVPHRRYLSGILFPGEADTETNLQDDILDEGAGEAGEDSSEDPVALASQQLPSSLGLSFVLPSWDRLKVEVTAGVYLADGKAWRRNDVHLTGDDAVTLLPPTTPGPAPSVPILAGHASLESIWRPLGDAALVTIALVNRRRLPATGAMSPEDCLLQVGIRCLAEHGFAPYPSPMRIQAGEEEEELALQYRDVPTYAVGHGCAAAWDRHGDTPQWVSSTHMPDYEIPGVAFDLEKPEDAPDQDDPEVLSLEFLATMADDPAAAVDALDEFVALYDDWSHGQEEEAATLASRHTAPAERLLARIDRARRRMRRGVRTLENDQTARTAFALANRAMLMQMVRSGPDYAGRPRAWNDDPAAPPSYTGTGRTWRPFQLAFLLLTLESASDENAEERDLIDLIWFPTGGGKTEAYLGLMAFTILHRRLTLGDAGAGTTVLTRYTLRLLTSQQFQRAATLICALEDIRRNNSARLGTERISIGVWLGGGNSPNTYADAVELLEKLKNADHTNISFQVEACPWCRTSLVPAGNAPEAAWGISAHNDSFRMHCPQTTCTFNDELPVSSVDDDLYDRPPTCLIGTVDKFARLTWEARAGVLLGSGNTPGPSLIIQDEFHLISGPLGTVVGLYEAAFDVVMTRHGARPKVVASTATIRRAGDQGRGVFGRETALFPPAGLRASHSFFVRHDPKSIGRRYVGVMPQGHTPLTGMVHLSAAMLQVSEEIALDPPADDAYWTLVAYHNSLRELGKSVTLAHDDIPARLGIIASADDIVRPLNDDDIIELTGNVAAAEIPRNLNILNRRRGEKGAASFVACTNMLSVGVDVPRLGLMLMVGQPKTTSEYIQATSRVGRSTPGLVVTLYSPSKPRDRSHFESFAPYHAALYRYVEPTSVTPFSVPARARALHAGLVVLVRHALGLSSNDAAAAFDGSEQELTDLISQFMRRVTVADPAERDDVERHLAELIGEWEGLKLLAAPSGGLRFAGGGKERIPLLRRFSQPGRRSWPTLDSMRSVDTEVRMGVRGENP